MPEIKIGVSAGVGGVDEAIAKITQRMNALAQAVGKSQNLKVEPTDMKTMARDLGLINKQFAQTLALSAQVRNALKNSGQSGLHLSQIDWSKTSTDPRAAQRMRDRAFLHSVRGSSLDPTLANDVDANGNAVAPGAGGAGGGSGGSRRPRRAGGGGSGGSGGSGEGEEEGRRSWWSRRPNGGWGTATALAVGNGIGGTAGNMITAGMGGGGLPGMGLALLSSTIGKGMEWAGQGMDQAKARNLDLDAIKRSMGDLGVSFNDLSEESWKFAQGLGMANGEFVKLEGQANAQSGGLYRTPEELARATRSGADLGRAYGLDPSQGVNFVAGMDRLNNRQNNKELATQLAQAIVTAQGKATPGEVMQAMQGFASRQNAFNSVNPNLSMFGNAYGDMLGSGSDMTADHASSILGTANSAMQHMGGTEASKNFLMQQFGMDPIRAQLRAEGGLFANGLDNPDVAGFMSQRGIKDWGSQSKGAAGSNLEVTMQGLDKAYGGRGQYGYEMELDAVKNMFGLKSLGDAASLANTSTSDRNGIASVLKNAGVNLSDVREGGLQAIAGISKTNDFDSLDKMYRSSIRGRPDMQPSDIAAMDKAEKSNDFQQMQNAMVRVLAGKGQEDTQATTQRSIDSNIQDIKTIIGGPLLTAEQSIMQGVLAMANKIPGVNIPNPLAPADAAVTGSGSPYGFGGAKGDPTVVKDMGIAGTIRQSSDGLHTATGGTWWDKTVDATAGGLGWLKGQGQDGSADTLGIRSNNPLNMLTKGQENVYSDPTAGIADAAANLERGYQGLTLAQITDKWTGGMRVKGNTPESLANYTGILSRATGLKADAKPNLDDPKVVSALIAAMIKAENGKMPYSDKQISAGVGAGMGGRNLSMKGFKPDMSIVEEPAAKGFTPDMSIVEEPPAKIPAKDRAAAAASASDAAAVAAGSKVVGGGGNGGGDGSLNGSDLVINLHQTVTTPGGATKTKTLSAKVPKPNSSGSRNQTIQVPS